MVNLPNLPGDLLTNIAASLAYDLLKSGASWLKDRAFGDPETQALQRAWQTAFETMLRQFSPPLDQYRASRVHATLQYFLKSQGIAELLLELALEDRPADLDMLERQFESFHPAPQDFPVDFKTAIGFLIPALSEALTREAKEPDSPLFQRVSLEKSGQVLKLVKQIASNIESSSIPTRRPVPTLQIPARPFHFKGRQQELTKLRADLQPGAVIALCGPAGIGKSALVAEFLWQITEEGSKPHPAFPDGVIYYSFYQQPDINFVLEHIIRTFDELPNPTLQSAAHRVLSNRRMILVLDGAEVTDDLEHVLAIRGQCSVIITSRQRDPFYETIYQVLPLEEQTSISLLQDIGGEWADDPTACSQISQLVGFLPLSIWLIGSYLKERQQTATEFGEWLAESPLTALDLSNRHRESVQVLIEKSLESVSPEAKVVLGVLGLFGMAPIYEGTLIFATRGKDNEARQWLGELIKYGFLRREGNYYIVYHALIYTYARERITASPDALKYLAGYFRLFTTLEPPSDYPEEDKQQGIEMLEAELKHLLPIMDRLLLQRNYEEVIDITRLVQDYLLRRGDRQFRLEICKLGLQAAREGQLPEDEIVMLRALGSIYEDSEQLENSMECFEHMLGISRILGNRQEESMALNGLGNIHQKLHQNDLAIGFFNDALAIAKEIKDVQLEGMINGNLGNVYLAIGQVEQATASYARSQELAHASHDHRGEAENLLNFAVAYQKAGKLGKAAKSMQQALVIARKMQDLYLEARILDKLGKFQMDIGNFEAALEHFENSLSIAKSINDKPLEIEILDYLGKLYAAKGDYKKAIDHAEASLQIARETRNKRSECILLINLGSAYSEMHDRDRAVDSYQQAIFIAKACDLKEYEVASCYGLGLNFFEEGNFKEAKQYLHQAFELLENTDSQYAVNIQNMLMFLSLF